MSELFILSDDVVNPVPSAAYKLNRDVLAGFREAIRRNQPTLAMEYLVHIVDTLAAEVEALKLKTESKSIEESRDEESAPALPKTTTRRNRTVDSSAGDSVETADV